MRSIGAKNRSLLLPYKDKSIEMNCKNNDKLWFIMPFNKSNSDINKIIYNSFNNTNNLFNLTNNGLKSLSVGSSVNPSLSSIFVHYRNLASNNVNHFTKPCILINCKICEFLNISNFIKFNDKFSLPILNESDCNSIGCIYIIYCNLCNLFYIGETGLSLKSRLARHIYKIKKLIPFEGSSTEISNHFNLKGHDYRVHLRVFIFKSGILDKLTRLNLESELIHLYLITGNTVLNSKIMVNVNHFFTSWNLIQSLLFSVS